MRLRTIYLDRWIKQFDSDELYENAKKEWASALGGMSGDEIRSALEKCKKYVDWPPSPSEFRKLGKNIISEEDALQAAVRRDFRNPIVSYAFKKIGAWDFSHDTDAVLRPKFKKAYQEAISANLEQDDSLRLEANSGPKKVEALSLGYGGKDKATDPPLLASFMGNFISGKDRIASILKKSQEVGQEIDWLGKSCPWWNPDEYEPTRRTYKKSVSIERRDFLLSLTEMAALSRSRDDQIDRFRFIGEKEANEIVEKNKREWSASNNTADKQKSTKTWSKDIYD